MVFLVETALATVVSAVFRPSWLIRIFIPKPSFFVAAAAAYGAFLARWKQCHWGNDHCKPCGYVENPVDI
jgi:hypothetical protein